MKKQRYGKVTIGGPPAVGASIAAARIPDEWLVENGYGEWAESSWPVWNATRTSRIGHETQRWVRLVPGFDKMRALIHYETGVKMSPWPKFTVGEAAEQWNYRGTGRVADRLETVKRITGWTDAEQLAFAA